MQFLASLILLVCAGFQPVIIAMSPAMMDAFGQIAQLEIISGIVDLQENEQIIKCTGRKNGGLYEVACRWANGFPGPILYTWVGTDL